MRPTFFFSRTLEKLGRTCDQIGRTLEPCVYFSTVNTHLDVSLTNKSKSDGLGFFI